MGRRSLLGRLLWGRPDGLRASIRRWFTMGTTTDKEPQTDAPVASKDVAAPEGYKFAVNADDVADGEVAEVFVDGVALVVVNDEGTYRALAGLCPHAGGPLGDGSLSNHQLTCPYHGWSFHTETGSCSVSESITLQTYPVVVDGGHVFVNVEV